MAKPWRRCPERSRLRPIIEVVAVVGMQAPTVVQCVADVHTLLIIAHGCAGRSDKAWRSCGVNEVWPRQQSEQLLDDRMGCGRALRIAQHRSEERRVGKECKTPNSANQEEKKKNVE